MTPTPNPPALLPCPFCGGKANGDGIARYSPPLTNTWWNDGSKITEAFFVNCMSCGIRNGSGLGVGYQTREKAHEHWNTRQAPAEPKVSREAVDAIDRSPAQFFFEVGFGASWAEAFVALNVAPFPLTDEKVERAWAIAGEAHDDPEEFDRMLALANGYLALSNPPADGDGWRAVPVEPTEAMLEAGFAASAIDWADSRSDILDVWNVMLAAAPPSAPLGAGGEK